MKPLLIALLLTPLAALHAADRAAFVREPRVVIQHGVNLKDISPDQDRDPALLARVRSTLSRMGIALEGGRS